MKLVRPIAGPGTAPLVPLVDVMMILLFFFLVTSSYLDLDMIPTGGAPGTAEVPAAEGEPRGAPLLLRLGPDDRIYVQGRALDGQALAARIAAYAAARPGGELAVLPAPQASTQALVSLIDTAARAGVSDVRILRISGAP